MSKRLRKLIAKITMVALFCSSVITPAMAATKLSPYHLYRWAKTNNYSRLHQYKRYINLQDENQNTALCLAQQAKDKHSYTTLLRFGASTEVSCHDDDDPICAIIAKEEFKLSPAWLLLGAGAAALALSSGGGSSDKEKLCDEEKYPNLNTCPTGQKSIDKCTDSKGTHHICACDESQNRYEDAEKCTKNANNQIGYDCSTQEQTGCYVRTELLCQAPETTSCEPERPGFILTDTLTGNYSGETACHTCSYACDAQNYYIETCPEGYTCSQSDTLGNKTCSKISSCDETTQFSTCPAGKNCSSTTNYGITCYKVLSDICDRTQFPYDQACTNTTGLKTVDTCTETTINGTFTYYQCSCDDTSGYYLPSTPLSTCGSTESNGWEFTSALYNGITCNQCEELSCPPPSTTSCQVASNGFILNQSATENFEGQTPCLNCSYSCDASKYYYPSCPEGYSCTGSDITQGNATCLKAMTCDEITQFSSCPTDKTCSSSTNYGITCYQVLGDTCDRTLFPSTTPCTDTTGLKTIDTCTETTQGGDITYYQCGCNDNAGYYDSAITDLKTCGTSGSNGWEFNTGIYGSLTCKTCEMLTCGANDYGYGTPNCPTVTGLDVSSSSSSDYHGNDQCYTCNYSCGTGLYSDLDECNDDARAENKICTAQNFNLRKGSLICYKIGDCDTNTYKYNNTCPNGMNEVARCSDGSGDHLQCEPIDCSAYTYNPCPAYTTDIDECTTNPDGSSEITTYQCACDATSGFYSSTASITSCGTSGSKGWEFSSLNNSPFNCKICQEKICNSAEGFYELCPAAISGMKLSSTTSTTAYKGETPCKVCTYSCDTSLYYSTTCPEGYSCSNSAITQGTTTCLKAMACDEITQFSSCPDGKTCSFSTNYNITCYKVLGDACDRTTYPNDEDCSKTTGLKTVDTCTETTQGGDITYYQCGCNDNAGYYDSAITDLKTCGTSGSNGWEFNTGIYGSFTCKTCDMLTCGENDYGYGAPNCPTVTGLDVSSSSSSDYHGNDQCYTCQYTCGTGYYDNVDDCNDDASASGKTCSPKTFNTQKGSVTCYQIGDCDTSVYNFDNTCPTGMNEVGSCSDANGTHKQCEPKDCSAFTETSCSTGTEIADSCTTNNASGTKETTTYKCACDTDAGYYASTINDLKTCGTSGSNGWEFTTPTTISGAQCKTCQMLTCGANDYGYGAPNCPSVTGLDVSSSSSSDYHGNDQCYTCQYTCGTGYYDNEDDCNDDASASGKTCSPKTFNTQKGSITCYQIGDCDTSVYNFDNTCPTGMNEVGSCSDANGTHKQCEPKDCSAFTETSCSTGTEIADSCTTNNASGTKETTTYKCACDADAGYYASTINDLKTCGTSGSNGWEFTTPTTISGAQCKTCQMLTCGANDYGYGAPNCPSVTGLDVSSSSSSDYHGNDQCYTCQYSCGTGYYDNEDDCNDDASASGKTCSPKTFNTQKGSVTCYQIGDCDTSVYNFDNTCPTGMNEVGSCSDANGTHKQCEPKNCSAFTETSCSTGTEIADSCTTNNASGTKETTTYKCTCDTDAGYYSSTTSDLKTCGTSGSNGWEFTTPTTISGASCKTCQMLTCGANDYGYGAPNCPSVAGLDVSSSSSSDYHGNDQCYTCNYTCDSRQGFYTDGSECKTNNFGRECTLTRILTPKDGFVQCYVKTACDTTIFKFLNECPTGMEEIDTCEDIAGTYYQCEPKNCSAFTETSCNTGTEIADSCTTNNASGTKETTTYKCTCDTDAGYYSSTTSDLKTCGTSGSNGWEFTTPTTISGASCKTCQMLTCGANDYGYGTPNCPTVTGLDVSSSSSSDYHGNDQCYTCQYTCGTGYYDNVDDCNDDAAASGKTCSPKTFNTQKGSVTCYQIGNCDTSIYNVLTSCPTGMTETGSCSDANGTHKQCAPNNCSAYTFSSCTTGTTSTGSCSTRATPTGTLSTTYKCGCDTTNGYYGSGTTASVCGTSGTKGWELISGTYNTLTCSTCSELDCNNASGYYDACPAAKTGLTLKSTASTTAYAGNDQCYTCSYTCNGTTHYTTESACETANSGKTCSSTSITHANGSTTCYVVSGCDSSIYNYAGTSCPTGMISAGSCTHNGTTYQDCNPINCSAYPQATCNTGTEIASSCTTRATPTSTPTTTYTCSCDTDAGYYASTITDLKTCGTSGSNGWEFTTPTTISGASCKTCQMLTCGANDYGYGTPNCPTVAGLDVSSSSSSDYHGNDQCYTCNYTCGTGYYDNVDDCNDDASASGKTCSPKTFNTQKGSVTCYQIGNCDTSTYNVLNSCPTGMTETGSCSDANGTHKQCTPNDCSAFTFSSCTTGTTSTGSCSTRATPTGTLSTTYKCACDTDAGYYASTTSDLTICGTTGANGWHFTTSTQNGITCKQCEENSCPTNTTAETCANNFDAISYESSSTTGITQYHGQTQCHTCVYSCKTGYYSNEDECIDENDECSQISTTVPQTGQTYYCYEPSLASLHTTLDDTINTQTIVKTSYGSEDVYGMSSQNDMKNTTNSTQTSSGKINITHNSSGTAVGMYGSSTNTLTNDKNAEINIQNNLSGTAVGMLASRGGSAINAGTITINGTSGTAIGILGLGENYIENSGTIDVSGKDAYGIKVEDGTNTEVVNKGTINVNATDNAYGIYIDKNATTETVINTGTISINGNLNDTSRSIVLNGAELRNKGLMSVSGNLNLNSLGASRVYLEDGAVYEAQSIEGDLTAGASNVMNNNLDTYHKEGAIKSNEIDNLNLLSESALFKANVKQNQNGSNDVVLTRKDFSEFTPNSSIAKALTKDYQAGKFEKTFDSLKQISSIPNLKQSIARTTGIDTIINFADENFQVLKSLNRTMADTILKPTDDTYRVIAGFDNYNLETDDKALLSGYELSSNSMFSFGDKRLNNWSRLGLGISFTDINTSYEKGGDRDLNIVSIFVPYLRKISDNLNLVSILNLGYGYGDFERNSNYETDLEEIIYGLTNELRYTINLNGFAELEPALMLNTIGYYEKGFDEGNSEGALQSKSSNNLSVEAGLGMYLKKEMSMEKYGKLGFKIGGAYYHEFGKPYRDMTMRLKSGTWYRVDDYANLYQRDRAVLEAIIDYAYKDLSMYIKYNKLIQKNNPDLFDMGIKFNF